MHLASLGIKTAFDQAKPKYVAQIMDFHDTHGWLIAALVREMSGLEGKATLECAESSFIFNKCFDKEAWKPRACGRRWQPRFGPMWKRNG